MEAFGLAKVCKFENVDFIALKYITDGLDDNGSEDWGKEISSCAVRSYEYLKTILED